jgi:para-aminobenzoate synthetase / 4-amino-4-deoxychorismate lyase
VIRAILDADPFGHLEFAEPRTVLAAGSLAEVRPVIRAAEAAAASGSWVAGFLTYEAAPAFDRALRVRGPAPRPLACFGVFGEPTSRSPGAGDGGRDARLCSLAPDLSKAQFSGSVERIRAALGRGEAYQVNFTMRLRGRFTGDPAVLYRRLHAAQGGSLSAFFQLRRHAVVSASPELFFERRGGGLVVRPMKGTAPRGRFGEEDDRLASELVASEKERAENVMITDLMRNDLGRVAQVGCVEVADLCKVERYRTVHQMTSTVRARLKPGTTLEHVFEALFPCGSVTGAPKVSAMGIIAAEERSPRGPYCGAAGVVAPGGDATFNVAIRTLDLDLEAGGATYGTGGGITWLSSADAEWEEALAKARFLETPATAFELVETLRVDGGACRLLARHLARLEASARHLGFAHGGGAVRAALEAEMEALGAGPHRLRLLLSEAGQVRFEASNIPEESTDPRPVALSPHPVSRRDPFLFHKTTRREVYDAQRARRPDVFDVLLHNQEGELTELTIGNLVAEIAGERLTPPRDAGLLAGVFRADLLARGEVRERTLREDDLRRARQLWLVNAVRGWVPIRLVR